MVNQYSIKYKYLKIKVLHKRFVFLLVVILTCNAVSYAQRQGSSLLNPIEKHDLGVFGGAAMYLGDFNDANLLYNPKPLAGILYRYNINPYFAIRAQAGATRVEGSSKDYYGSLPGFPTGDAMAFDRSMIMVDGLFELNFLPYTPLDVSLFCPRLMGLR